MFSDEENCKLGCILITTIVVLLGSLMFNSNQNNLVCKPIN